ncbi:MAG: hypothetical protein WA323_12435 [Candidatus Nitrosopolaris sp.]|jgi:hypothetical protein
MTLQNVMIVEAQDSYEQERAVDDIDSLLKKTEGFQAISSRFTCYPL